MNKKSIIYLVHTEFQLMVAVNLSVSLYDSAEYSNTIYYIVASRLSEGLDTSIDINGELIAIPANDHISKFKQLAETTCYRAYFFQENSIYNKFLAYNLKKKGAIIALGPDGTKPYGVFSKSHETLSMIKDTVKDYMKLRNSGMSLPTLIPSRYYRYGSSRIIDEVWLYNTALFNAKKNRTKGILKEIPQISEQVWQRLRKLFKYSDDLLPQKEGVLFYINQPLWTKELVNEEIAFLEGTKKLFPNRPIIIKLHPLTQQTTVDRYLEVDNFPLIRSKIPAELFLGSLTNSIAFSGWSAGLSIPNPECNYYYLLKVFQRTKDTVLEQIEFVTFDHIQLIDKPEQLEFKYAIHE